MRRDAIRGIVTSSREDIAELFAAWEAIRTFALSQEESIDFIRKVIEEKWTWRIAIGVSRRAVPRTAATASRSPSLRRTTRKEAPQYSPGYAGAVVGRGGQ
jgi:hypothetical protein